MDFLNKFMIVKEYADETIHFLHILLYRFPNLETSILPLVASYDVFPGVVARSIQSIRKKRMLEGKKNK